MSKFVTILCATALCFAMASTANDSGMLQRNEVINHINFAMDQVRLSLQSLNLQFAVIQSDSLRKNYNTLAEFNVNISREIEESRPLIDVIINDANSTFNETQCRSYWVEYEAVGRRLLCKMKALIPSSLNATLTQIREAIKETTDALQKLQRFRSQADSCQASLCYRIRTEVGSVYRNFSQKTHSILCRASRLTEELKIQQVGQTENLYADYLIKSGSLITNTRACVNTTHHYS